MPPNPPRTTLGRDGTATRGEYTVGDTLRMRPPPARKLLCRDRYHSGAYEYTCGYHVPPYQ